MALARQHARPHLSGGRSGARRANAAHEDAVDATDDPYPYTLRLGVMLVMAGLKCGGQAGLCWRFFSESAMMGRTADTALKLIEEAQALDKAGSNRVE